MDSKRKHELETNDLKDFLDNFKDFWDRNGNFILILLIVVIGGWAAMRYYNSHKTNTQNEAYYALSSEDDPDLLVEIADKYSMVRDPALLRAGDLYIDRSRLRMSRNETEKAEDDLEQAQAAYERLIDETDADEFIANAYLGLATVAQARQDWDAAEKALASARDTAGDKYPGITDQVESSEALLAELRNLIAFASAPAPLPELDLPDIDLPDSPGGDTPPPLGPPFDNTPPEGADGDPLNDVLPEGGDPVLPLPGGGDATPDGP